MSEQFSPDHIHTTTEGRHFRHGDGVEMDGDGNPKTSFSAAEAVARWSKFTLGNCKDGYYEVIGDTRTMAYALGSLHEYQQGATVEMTETNLRGWPGEDFVCVRLADGQPAFCGFAERK